MARAPFQILVYPYRRTGDGQIEYALFERAREGFWQGIAGGGEGDEKPLEAAKRESYEEAGIGPDSGFVPLDTVESVPVTEFRDSHLWGENVYVIPQYCFGVSAGDLEIRISREHAQYRWVSYDEAYQLMKYDGNKTALWELNQRLKGRGPRG
jgi:dATP pyrophosphohydrolase